MDLGNSQPCELKHLALNSAHTAYEELRVLLDALPSKGNTERKNAILDFALQTRHRMARLLGATRWAIEYGTKINAAVNMETRYNGRTTLLDDTADSLWAMHSQNIDKPLPASELGVAVDAMTTGSFNHFPRLPETSLGIEASGPMQDAFNAGPFNNSGDSLVNQSTQELGLATRNSIRDSIGFVPGIEAVAWRVGVADVCVRIGAPGLWAANISLDGLNTATAVLRCHQLSIVVSSDPDAPGAVGENCAPSCDDRPESMRNSISPTEESMLCRLADDRMAEAAAAASAAVSTDTQVGRMQVMLRVFHEMLCVEVCAPLIMGHLRSQGEALRNSVWGDAIQVQGCEPEAPRRTPITIHYWLNCSNTASLTITEYHGSNAAPEDPRKSKNTKNRRENSNEDAEDFSDQMSKRKLIRITHNPPLPGYAGKDYFKFIEHQANSLNLEKLLKACIRVRSSTRLLSIADAVLQQREKLKVHPKCLTIRSTCTGNEERVRQMGTRRIFSAASDEALVVHLHPDRCTGLDIRIAARTGGLRVRPFGSASLSVATSKRQKEGLLWSGHRQIRSKSEEELIVSQVLFSVRSNCKLDAAARAVCALDIGVSNTLPPGTASVAATASAERAASQLVPPFAPLERRSPRRFLTLSPPPPAKDPLSGIEHSFVTAVDTNARGCVTRDGTTSKRPRLTYATTSDALVFIQESSFANDDKCHLNRPLKRPRTGDTIYRPGSGDMDDVDRYSGSAAAAAAWAVTRDVVERRLRRDSLLRAFVAANVASAAHTHHMKSGDEGALHLESASRVLLKVKSEPLPVRRAELLLRGSDAWQVRLSLLPPIFDSTDAALSTDSGSNSNTIPSTVDRRKRNNGGDEGNLWTVGVACGGSQLTFTYPSANAASVRSFFRDLTRARTAAALARGVPPSPFYRVLRRSPVRIVVGIGPFHSRRKAITANGTAAVNAARATPSYTATVEYVYSKGNNGGFSLNFSPTKQTMQELAPLIEEALDASGGQVGGILAGLLERACPVAAAAEAAVRERGNGRIRFVTALRVRAVFAGIEPMPQSDVLANSGAQRQQAQQNNGKLRGQQVAHAVDVDARGGGGVVTVIDVGRATAVMIQQGFANRSGASAGGSSGAQRRSNDFVLVPKWDEIVAELCREGYAEAQRAGSTVVVQMSKLEQFLTSLVSSVKPQ